MTRRILVTGGAGFIGSNFIRLLLDRESASQVTNLDALTYAGVEATVDELNRDPRHHLVHGDIRDGDLVDRTMAGQDIVVHFAAESHVDRSIAGPGVFLETNVVGTGVLIEAARRHGVSRFIHVSTDEVYGSITDGYALETDRLAPTSPYSASKAASDLVALSYAHTFGFPVLVTRCTNNYGPYQFPEKVIPLFITNLLDGLRIPLYGNGLNQRDWLHVLDHCEALLLLLDSGEPGEIYNIGANAQLSNIDLTNRILTLVGCGEEMIQPVPDRAGHDFRYAVDSSKIKALGWAPAQSFDQRLAETVEWYSARRDWWEPLKRVP